jgi:hypothetical protein
MSKKFALFPPFFKQKESFESGNFLKNNLKLHRKFTEIFLKKIEEILFLV